MHKIYVYKSDDCWWFDDPKKNITREELVLGTPEFIEEFLSTENFDLIFDDSPIGEDQITIHFSRHEEGGHIYSADAESATLSGRYQARNKTTEFWLCNVLLQYFQKPPDKIYLICITEWK